MKLVQRNVMFEEAFTLPTSYLISSKRVKFKGQEEELTSWAGASGKATARKHTKTGK